MNLQSKCLFCSVLLALSATAEQVPKNLLEGLSSEHFKVRESSQSDIEKWVDETGSGAVKAIFEIYQETDDPEVRLRCEEILKTQSDKDYLNDGQGFLGVSLLEVMINLAGDDKPRFGIKLASVMPVSPAQAAGLKAGDIITSMDDQKWNDPGAMNKLIDAVASYKPRRKVVFMVQRAGHEELIEIPVILGKRPVEDLDQLYYKNIEEFEREAKNKHFAEWLKKFEPVP